MKRVQVSTNLLKWARQRAGIESEALIKTFPKYEDWEAGTVQPTLKQLERFAQKVHVPIGYLFLAEPPEEPLPVPDFRTFNNTTLSQPSPDLLDMLYNCQERQAWYREFAQIHGQPPLSFVGSLDTGMSIIDAADQIRSTLGFHIEKRRNCRTWEDALRLFRNQAEEAGILAMASGIVLSNSRRKLDPQEFRGFALSDKQAPLIFINSSDSKSAQMFTLAHELAHIWLDSSGVSNAGPAPLKAYPEVEIWCNAVAAELLVPLKALSSLLSHQNELDDLLPSLTRHFKVSSLVILRRLLDAGWFDRPSFEIAWQNEIERLKQLSNKRPGGGDFSRSTVSRVGRRFAQALIASTLEGHTLYRDAFRMLGIKQTNSFHQLGREVGVLL